MQKPNLTKICRNVKTATVKHSPEILTGVGIAGMITTTVMAVRSTLKQSNYWMRKSDVSRQINWSRWTSLKPLGNVIFPRQLLEQYQ